MDVRDLGGHLDFTSGVRAGTLSSRVRDATTGAVAVGALPLAFQVKLGLVFLLVFMLLMLRMFPPLLLEPARLQLLELCGLVKCLLLTLQLFSACLKGLRVLIQLFILSGPGSA